MGKQKKIDDKEYPGPPSYLSERSKALWMEFVGTRVKNTGKILVFQSALEALDLADVADDLGKANRLVNG